jgi:hypothetical protein
LERHFEIVAAVGIAGATEPDQPRITAVDVHGLAAGRAIGFVPLGNPFRIQDELPAADQAEVTLFLVPGFAVPIDSLGLAIGTSNRSSIVINHDPKIW